MRALATAAIATALALGALAGCNIVAPAYLLVHGPEKVKRAHTLDEERPTVIFIDDRANRVSRRALRVAAIHRAERLLLDEGALNVVVNGEAALALASRDTFAQPMTVAEIGRAVQAEVVIYTTVDVFSLTPDGQTFAPLATVRVKVIDAKEDTRIWPADPKGALVEVRVPAKQGFVPEDLTTLAKSEQELAELMGERIAELFYDHERVKHKPVPD